MTFGVIGRDEPLLAELIALAFESVGHECLVFDDLEHATRILGAIRLDAILLAIHTASGNGLDWLEALGAIQAELPSRALLLTNAALTPEEAARIEMLGAEVAVRPRSVIGIEKVVMGRLKRARLDGSNRLRWRGTNGFVSELLH